MFLLYSAHNDIFQWFLMVDTYLFFSQQPALGAMQVQQLLAGHVGMFRMHKLPSRKVWTSDGLPLPH